MLEHLLLAVGGAAPLSRTPADPVRPPTSPVDRYKRDQEEIVVNASAQSSRLLENPLASGSAQFPLGRPSDEAPGVDAPSPIGLRPWGLRRVGPVFGTTGGWSAWRYDHERQIAVDGSGLAVLEIVDGPPTAPTTPPTDGEDPPSGEDWRNDYTPDYPVQP